MIPKSQVVTESVHYVPNPYHTTHEDVECYLTDGLLGSPYSALLDEIMNEHYKDYLREGLLERHDNTLCRTLPDQLGSLVTSDWGDYDPHEPDEDVSNYDIFYSKFGPLVELYILQMRIRSLILKKIPSVISRVHELQETCFNTYPNMFPLINDHTVLIPDIVDKVASYIAMTGEGPQFWTMGSGIVSYGELFSVIND